MPTVTVPGANKSTVTLAYDIGANAVLAQQIAAVISAGIANNTISAADNKSGSPPALPPGVTGELVLSQSATTLVPKGYDFVVASAKSSVVFGNGDKNEQVLAGSGNLRFVATGGSGSIITGGGNNLISILPSDKGDWLIAMGNGNDTIGALGGGNDTITASSGKHLINLGSGSSFVTTAGSDSIFATSGSETIVASGSDGKQVISGGASKLFFIAGGAATVIGGTGSDTVFGGSGKELLEGGSAGGNFLQAGDGRATLFGGGNGDQLFAAGDKAQALHAASGNETLFGGFASGRDTFFGGSGKDQITGGGGKNTFVAGTGAATVAANPGASNVFEFVHGKGGGKELVEGLTAASQVHIELLGFGSNEIKNALASQTSKDGSTTITLSDSTKVTFQNVGLLTTSNFSESMVSGKETHDHHDH